MLLNLYSRYQVVLLSFLTGCSTPPAPQPLSDCERVANYARSIAMVRDVGVTKETLLVKAASSEITFPVEGVMHEVYSRPQMGPAETYKLFVSICNERGYNRMKVTLRELLVERWYAERDKEKR